jgi:integrase
MRRCVTRRVLATGPPSLSYGLASPGFRSLSRRAGADLRLLHKAMGHASITVTAHTYADLFDDELDNIAVALDSLSDDLSHRT